MGLAPYTRVSIVDSSVGSSKRRRNINITIDTNSQFVGQPTAYIEVPGFGAREWGDMAMGEYLDIYTEILNAISKAGYTPDPLETSYVVETRLLSGIPAYRLAWPVQVGKPK